MLRRCEPLFDGDQREVCGAWFDDARRMAVCPHVSLDGGDSKGVAPDPEYLVAKGVLTVVDAKAMQARAEEDQLLIRQRDGSTVPMGEWMAHGNVAYQRTPSPSGPVQWDGDVHTDTIRHTIESQAARYVLVDVLDVAVLLGHLEARARDAGRRLEGSHAELHARVSAAPLATVPCTIKLNDDGGVWITSDQVVQPPDPRLSNVPRPATPMTPGAHDDQVDRPMVSRGNLVDMAPHQVRTYGVYPASSVGEVVGFLNAHRELTPVAIIPEPRGTLMVLYVELRP